MVCGFLRIRMALHGGAAETDIAFWAQEAALDAAWFVV